MDGARPPLRARLWGLIRALISRCPDMPLGTKPVPSSARSKRSYRGPRTTKATKERAAKYESPAKKARAAKKTIARLRPRERPVASRSERMVVSVLVRFVAETARRREPSRSLCIRSGLASMTKRVSRAQVGAASRVARRANAIVIQLQSGWATLSPAPEHVGETSLASPFAPCLRNTRGGCENALVSNP
jgi:hypothetical protein